jgi:hypothetical protein
MELVHLKKLSVVESSSPVYVTYFVMLLNSSTAAVGSIPFDEPL